MLLERLKCDRAANETGIVLTAFVVQPANQIAARRGRVLEGAIQLFSQVGESRGVRGQPGAHPQAVGLAHPPATAALPWRCPTRLACGGARFWPVPRRDAF